MKESLIPGKTSDCRARNRNQRPRTTGPWIAHARAPTLTREGESGGPAVSSERIARVHGFRKRQHRIDRGSNDSPNARNEAAGDRTSEHPANGATRGPGASYDVRVLGLDSIDSAFGAKVVDVAAFGCKSDGRQRNGDAAGCGHSIKERNCGDGRSTGRACAALPFDQTGALTMRASPLVLADALHFRWPGRGNRGFADCCRQIRTERSALKLKLNCNFEIGSPNGGVRDVQLLWASFHISTDGLRPWPNCLATTSR